MIHYIKELVETLQHCHAKCSGELRQKFGATQPEPGQLVKALVEELNRLDPRDFEGPARHEFVVYRSVLRPFADRGSHGMTLDTPTAYAVKIASLLDLYAGEGTGAKTRDFSFMTDANVLKIVERDYRELSLRTFPRWLMEEHCHPRWKHT